VATITQEKAKLELNVQELADREGTLGEKRERILDLKKKI
jgi:hypothetical protein